MYLIAVSEKETAKGIRGMEQDAVDCPAICKIGVIRASQGYLSNAT